MSKKSGVQTSRAYKSYMWACGFDWGLAFGQMVREGYRPDGTKVQQCHETTTGKFWETEFNGLTWSEWKQVGTRTASVEEIAEKDPTVVWKEIGLESWLKVTQMNPKE